MRESRPLLDRGRAILARGHVAWQLRRFDRATRQVRLSQDRLLLSLLRRNRESDFGREHGFRRIPDMRTFQSQVPIRDYEALLPYFKAVYAGRAAALFGPGERILMFALTSGTTSEPKRIPITPRFIKNYRRGWNLFGCQALSDHPEAVLRPILQVASPMDEEVSPAGLPCGAISGMLAATQKRLVRRYFAAPAACAAIRDPELRYYAILRFALAKDVAFVVTASPATPLKLAEMATRYAESLIRDIHDGMLTPPEGWREYACSPESQRAPIGSGPPSNGKKKHPGDRPFPSLVPSPETAKRLSRILNDTGALKPAEVWRLSFLANWTGGTLGLYLRDFPRYFGVAPVREIGLLATEGRVTVGLGSGGPEGVLDVPGAFFEFIPEGDEGRTLLADELETGAVYRVVMSNDAGLYRYDLGDYVRVTGFWNQAPTLEFLHRGAHVSSLSGEKLTERQVVEAVESAFKQWRGPSREPWTSVRADLPAGRGVTTSTERRLESEIALVRAEAPSPVPLGHAPPSREPPRCAPGSAPASGSPVQLFILSPVWGHPPYYRFFVEMGASQGANHQKPAVPPGRLAEKLDEELGRLNVEYASKRRSGRLGPVRLEPLPAGSLEARDSRLRQATGRGHEQFKHKFLLTRPGEDEDLHRAAVLRAE